MSRSHYMSMCILAGGMGWADSRVLDILKLELQGCYELHDVGDGTKFGSFARWMHSLNYWFTSPTHTSLFSRSLNWFSKLFHISHLFLVLSMCKRLEKVFSSMPLLWARQGVASEWKNRFYKNSRVEYTKRVGVFNYRRLCRMPISGWDWQGH